MPAAAAAVPVAVVASSLRLAMTRRDELVVEAAFDLHAEALNGFAVAAVHDQDIADDLVQESFVRLVREIRAGREPDNVRAWLFRVCANLVVSNGRRRALSDRMRFRLVDRWTVASPEEAAIRRDEDIDMKHALDGLRPGERVALLLSASGFSAEEIGHAIGRTPNATRAFICRARIRLRDILSSTTAVNP